MSRSAVSMWGALVAALLMALAGCGGEGPQGPTEQAENPSDTKRAKPKAERSERSSSRRSSPETSLEAYSAELYAVRVPAGWEAVADEEVQSDAEGETLVRSRWVSPDGATLTIDTVEGDTRSAAENAALVRDAVSQRPGYEGEEGFGPVALGGREAQRWRYSEDGESKVDYFSHEDCNVGYAVLGEAPESGFERHAELFEAVARSLEPRCPDGGEGVAARGEGSGGPAGDPDGSGGGSDLASGPAGANPPADSFGEPLNDGSSLRSCGVIEAGPKRRWVQIKIGGADLARCGRARELISSTFGKVEGASIGDFDCGAVDDNVSRSYLLWSCERRAGSSFIEAHEWDV